jgi:hypothetical protein
MNTKRREMSRISGSDSFRRRFVFMREPGEAGLGRPTRVFVGGGNPWNPRNPWMTYPRRFEDLSVAKVSTTIPPREQRERLRPQALQADTLEEDAAQDHEKVTQRDQIRQRLNRELQRGPP